jgi:prepilin-type N-terminal cleavage/methylation domain-containing protein/prepilin-type processing-associated H-X9-DG protein
MIHDKRISQYVRSGFTIIELVVTIGVIAILVTLSLVAVQYALESSRRISCQNNLRQIAMSCQNYETRWRSFQPGCGKIPTYHFGPWVPILADLEVVLDSAKIMKTQINIQGMPKFDFEDVRPRVLVCPSDEGRGINYRVNMGSEPYPTRVGGSLKVGDGAYVAFESVRLSEFTDGLSNTALVSERLQGKGRQSRASVYFFGQYFPNADEACEVMRGDIFVRDRNDWAGGSWAVGGFLHSWYTHIDTPNAPRDGFFTDGDFTPTYSAALQGAVGTSSNHGSGINVSFADGSVSFVDSSVDRNLWREIGTKSGGR